MDDSRREVLLKEYGEVLNNFRVLTDIRFRLLSYLPLISGLVAEGTAIKGGLGGFGTFILALLSFAATIGLATYNERNDQLYDTLIGRAATLERNLGLPDGYFANRPRSWLSLKIAGYTLKVDHVTAIVIIYSASTALWLTLLFAAIVEAARRVYGLLHPPCFVVTNTTPWVNAIALVLAIGTTASGAYLIKKQKEARREDLERMAAEAYHFALWRDVHVLLNDDKGFIPICAKLADGKLEEIRDRAKFYARIDPASLGFYLCLSSPQMQAAHLVALLTDFAPQWILRCG